MTAAQAWAVTLLMGAFLALRRPHPTPSWQGIETADQRPVPCLVHQTYTSLAAVARDRPAWAQAQAAWHRLLADGPCEYRFWSDAALRALVQRHVPGLLSTYDAYPYPIQRVDAARYVMLLVHGGVYIDLDIAPRPTLRTGQQLQRLLQALDGRAALDHGLGYGVSNDLMAGPPGHPLWAALVQRLPAHAQSYGPPYLTVLLSTGSLFATRTLATLANASALVTVGPTLGQHVVHLAGNSWHAWDASWWLGLYQLANRARSIFLPA